MNGNINDNLAATTKFSVVGFIASEHFQQSKYAVNKLYHCFPKKFQCPEIRSMLDLEWNEYIKNLSREQGNGIWSIKHRVVIFLNGNFLGDLEALSSYILKKWKLAFNKNWQELACHDIMDYLAEKNNKCRQLAYLTIAIDNRMIGSLLFELYNDLVPLACANFLNRCRDSVDGYLGTNVHRIVKNSWIQCGKFNLIPINMRCENYAIPHNRRGVLSTCNNGRHIDNSTQFCITLEKAEWMDYNYVGFGQLIHGDEILKIIENVPTYYQSPRKSIKIVKCGEFKTNLTTMPSELFIHLKEDDPCKQIETDQLIGIIDYLKTYHEIVGPESSPILDDLRFLSPIKSVDTMWSLSKFNAGKYCLANDLMSHLPFYHLSQDAKNNDGAEDMSICDELFATKQYKKNVNDPDYDSSISSKSAVTL